MAENLKNKVVRGAFWVLVEKFTSFGVTFGVTLILARLLTPGDYGMVSLLSIFMLIAGALVTSGMGMALVQKKDADDLDFNSLFYATIVSSLILYGMLFLGAPYIAEFYDEPVLCPILRVTAITLVFSGINSVQAAELQRKMLFHLSFRISLAVNATSAVVGITMAFLSYGPWALVWSGVASGFVGIVVRWVIIAWRPKLMFSWKRLKGLFSFGWKLTAIGLIYTLYTNIYGLLIGKCYSKEDLAFVNKGRSTPDFAMGFISGTICGVSFPALAQMQDDKDRMRKAVRRMIQCTSFMVFPMMCGVAICSHDLVLLLFGEKWLPCVPFMTMACFQIAIQPFHDINLQSIAAMGRGDVFLKLELIKDAVGCLVMALCLSQSVMLFMAACAFVVSPIALYVNTWHNRKFLNYSVWQQLRDVRGIAFSCAVMSAVVLALSFVLPERTTIARLILTLATQAIIGAAVYFALAFKFKIAASDEYLNLLMPKLRSIGVKFKR